LTRTVRGTRRRCSSRTSLMDSTGRCALGERVGDSGRACDGRCSLRELQMQRHHRLADRPQQRTHASSTVGVGQCLAAADEACT
jgi:hypothetical protein